jgi:hypothetical protein
VKKIILFIFATSLGLSVWAQDSTASKKNNPKNTNDRDRKTEKRQRINAMIKQEEEGNLSFRKQTAFGIQLRTDGYGGFFELGRRKSPRFTNTYSLEITEIKHRKEEKSNSVENLFSSSFIYGKINNFYQVKLGFGQQYILGQKGNKNGVAVLGIVQGGIDLGLLKPYYLHIQDSANNERTISYYDDPQSFVFPVQIFGSGGLGKGWNQLKMKPGLYLKTALRFDFGRYNETIQALEIGMSLEAFSQKIPIMVFNDAKQLFYQGHIAFVFGSRKK